MANLNCGHDKAVKMLAGLDTARQLCVCWDVR